MGRVFRGRHEQTHDQVAVKVLYGSMTRKRLPSASPCSMYSTIPGQPCDSRRKICASLTKRARISSRIIEPLIGESLATRLERQRISPYKAIDVLGDVAKIVAYAHEQSVVHRDLKPANIFLTSDGKVKVLDFGIAKLRDDTHPVTRTGIFFGTPEYCSPAQIESTKNAGPQDDAWSLCAILYEMLIGARAYPFNGSEIGKVISSRKFLPERRGLDNAQWAIIAKGLCLDPKGQYTSAEPLAQDLERYLRVLANSQQLPVTQVRTTSATPAVSPTFRAGGTIAPQGGVLPPAGLTDEWKPTLRVEVKASGAEGAPRSPTPPRASRPARSWSIAGPWLAIPPVALLGILYFGTIIAWSSSSSQREPTVALAATDVSEDANSLASTDAAVDEDGGREPGRRRHVRRGTRVRRPNPIEPSEETPSEAPRPTPAVDPIGYPISPSMGPFGNVGEHPPAPTSQALQNQWLRRNWDNLPQRQQWYWCNLLHNRDRIFPGSAATDLPEGCRQHLPLRPRVVQIPSYWR